jgi:hypothetical protein
MQVTTTRSRAYHFEITTDHAASSYNRPVVLINGKLSDWTPSQVGAMVLASASSHLSDQMSDLNSDPTLPQRMTADEYDRQSKAIDDARNIVEAIEVQLDPSNVMEPAR